MGPGAAVLRRRLRRLLAAWAPSQVSPCVTEPDVPAAIGATDAELRRLARELTRDPADSVWATRSALTLLGLWKT